MNQETAEETTLTKLNKLLREETPDEDIKTITDIKTDIEKLQGDYIDLENKYSDLRSKYVKAIQRGDFGTGDQTGEEVSKPMTLEELIEKIKKEKGD